MTITTLVLYGSRARDDNSSSSDVDLFAVTPSGDYRMIVTNKINTAVYPIAAAMEMSARGDLFMLHITTEGRLIYDHSDEFRKLSEAFKFRSSYEADIRQATELGWAILKFSPKIKNWMLVNKRIAWCVRTIIIAKAASCGRALFSAAALAEYSQDADVIPLISLKDLATQDPREINRFRKFLVGCSGGSPEWLDETDRAEVAARFRRDRNFVGEKTLRSFLGEAVRDSYS